MYYRTTAYICTYIFLKHKQSYKLPFSVSSAGESSHNRSVSQDNDPGKGPTPVIRHTGPNEFAAVTWLEVRSTLASALIRMAMNRENEVTIGDRSHVSVRSIVSYSVNWKTSPPLMSISRPPFASLKKFVSDLHEFGPFFEVRVGHYIYGEDRWDYVAKNYG